MSDAENNHNQHFIVDVVYDAIIADAQAVGPLFTL
jgi:hypothetical protein